MGLFELGIIVDGMVIWEKVFKEIEIYNKKIYITKGQFLSSVFEFQKMILNSNHNIMKIKLKEYSITIVQYNDKMNLNNISKNKIYNMIFGYSIGDHKIDLKYTIEIIKRILCLYVNKFYNPTTNGIIKNLQSNIEYNQMADKIIGDFYLDAIERFKNIFY